MSEQGWGWLSNSPKWHWFTKDGRSLCGKWFTFQKDFDPGMDNSPDNCRGCKKKLAKAAQKETEK